MNREGEVDNIVISTNVYNLHNPVKWRVVTDSQMFIIGSSFTARLTVL